MSMGRKRVLVTGARGFLGRPCLGRLAARGYEIHAVSSSAHSDAEATWHRCNLLDTGSVSELVAHVRPSHLLHLAWIATPGVFWSSPANLDWLAAGIRLVQAFYAAGGERAVGVGTCAEYAASDDACREDTTPIAPATVYGASKAAMYLAWLAAAGGQRQLAWARLFFPYGPGEPRGRYIPSVIDALLRGEALDCTHGHQVRDFIYVDDIAEACAALVAGTESGAYNVGSGSDASLRDVAEKIVGELGGRELVRFGAREAPAHDLARIVADIGKIREHFGWSPRVSLGEGLHRTIAAHRGASQRAQ
jgi:nucleoside-diphosphate-sugar epimerase